MGIQGFGHGNQPEHSLLLIERNHQLRFIFQVQRFAHLEWVNIRDNRKMD